MPCRQQSRHPAGRYGALHADSWSWRRQDELRRAVARRNTRGVQARMSSAAEVQAPYAIIGNKFVRTSGKHYPTLLHEVTGVGDVECHPCILLGQQYRHTQIGIEASDDVEHLVHEPR